MFWDPKSRINATSPAAIMAASDVPDLGETRQGISTFSPRVMKLSPDSGGKLLNRDLRPIPFEEDMPMTSFDRAGYEVRQSSLHVAVAASIIMSLKYA